MHENNEIKAVIFDMDGLLIDSEPLWREAQIEVFSKVGVTLTHPMCFQTIGLRIDDAVAYWHRKFPWKDKTHNQVKEEIVQKVIELVNEKGTAMPGVYQVLALFERMKLPIALASSSPSLAIKAVLNKLQISPYFKAIHSAEVEAFGKPHPAVYLATAHALKVSPYNCLVFEDSFNGVIAARAARMKVIAVPEKIHFSEPHFQAAHLILPSLEQFHEQVFRELTV
jgi:HAD superfamily hydrolase (TIGR01509 family)